MKISSLTFLFVFTCLVKVAYSQQQKLGDFSTAENFEWPRVIWSSAPELNWDEGLIKTAPFTNGVSRSGFGIHMNENRQFTFWSSGPSPLLSIEGGSGNSFFKGKIGLGTWNPKAIIDVGQTLDGGNLGIVLGRMSEGNNVGNGTFLGVRGYGTQNTDLEGKGFAIEHNFYGVTNSAINFYRGSDTFGGFITFSTNNNSEQLRIDSKGNVGIGTTTPAEKLSVNGNIRAKEIKVESVNWPDYVFDKGYHLADLQDIKRFITDHGHLPDMPSAKKVLADGQDLGDIQIRLLKKVEELTLHVIRLDELNKKQAAQIIGQEKRIEKQQGEMAELKNITKK